MLEEGLFAGADGKLSKAHTHVHWLAPSGGAPGTPGGRGGWSEGVPAVYRLQYDFSRKVGLDGLLCGVEMEHDGWDERGCPLYRLPDGERARMHQLALDAAASAAEAEARRRAGARGGGPRAAKRKAPLDVNDSMRCHRVPAALRRAPRRRLAAANERALRSVRVCGGRCARGARHRDDPVVYTGEGVLGHRATWGEWTDTWGGAIRKRLVASGVAAPFACRTGGWWYSIDAELRMVDARRCRESDEALEVLPRGPITSSCHPAAGAVVTCPRLVCTCFDRNVAFGGFRTSDSDDAHGDGVLSRARRGRGPRRSLTMCLVSVCPSQARARDS